MCLGLLRVSGLLRSGLLRLGLLRLGLLRMGQICGALRRCVNSPCVAPIGLKAFDVLTSGQLLADPSLEERSSLEVL
jgi:hypothetical protein